MKKERQTTAEADSVSSASFYLRTLGDLALSDRSEKPVNLRTRKSLLLLACLASNEERSWSREKLAALLWGDRQEEQARNSLRSALSDIRRVLGNDALAAEGNSVRLDDDILTSDIEQLRHMTRSDVADDPGSLRTFYGGDFLPEIDDSVDGTEWISEVRTEARDLASAVMEKSSEHLASVGDLKTAIVRAREQLSLDPLSERCHRRLMRLYADHGERSKAIAQFRSCRDLVKRELGVEPSAETRQLADEIAIRADAALPDLMDIATAPLDIRATSLGAPGASTPDNDSTISIAVLPFVNMSGDADQDYFAEGIWEDIVTDLSKITDLSVAAAGATRMYRTVTMSYAEIAAELGVEYLLEGSVRRSDRDLRITARLIDGRTDRQIWGERYDRELTRIFDVQAEIAGSVASAVHSEVSPTVISQATTRGTRSLEAHEHYSRGRALLKEMTRRSVEMSKACFEHAIEIDRHYALAFAGLAESISMLGWHYEADKALLEEAIGHCQKALKLDPGLAEAHCSLGRVHSLFLRVEEAEVEFGQAIEISPSLQEAHLYRAMMYLTVGRANDAIAPLRRAFELGGQDLHTGMMLINCQQALGLTDEQQATAERVLKHAQGRMNLNPYDDQAAYVGASALNALGETSDAVRWANLAAAYDIDDARSTYNIACLFAVLGEFEQALAFLKKTLDLGVPDIKLEWIRHNDSDWAGLRDNPEFRKIVGV